MLDSAKVSQWLQDNNIPDVYSVMHGHCAGIYPIRHGLHVKNNG